MRISATIRLAAALGVTLLLCAADESLAAQPQPGQWRVVTKMTMTGLPPGMPAGMGAQENTQMQCVTPEMARDPKNWKSPDSRGDQSCTHKNSWNGSVLTLDATCAGNPPSTVKGTITFDSPTHYRGVMNPSASAGGMTMQMTITMEGQRVGECPR